MAMPIRRPSDNDPDWMARRQDEELISLEKRISALYEEASTELSEEYERFFTDYQLEYENRLAMVESGEMTEDAFQNWCRHKIFQNDRYQAMIRMLTDVLVNSDVAAMAAVNEQLPYTLAESYDFISSLGFEAADQAGISMGTFQIYNADSVQAIIRDNPDLLPVVDLPEDELWNRNHINNEITQAIIRGDSMQQVAQRLQRVARMDNNAAIRNARTSMTAAENLGRSESARRLKQKGLPVDEVWSATHDARTRDSHLLLDGTRRDEKTGKFGVGIIEEPYLRFPADPEGQAKEIYNCRCRLNVQIAGIDHSKDDELYENFMRDNYPEDWQALQQREAESGKADERREALERQARLRAEREAQAVPKGYADANDLERAIMADGGSLNDPRLLAYSNALEAENSYNASLRNNLEQAIQENGYTEGIRNALEAEERDAQRYLDNLPELKTPEQIATAEAMQERLRILSELKPSQAQEIVSAPISMNNADIPEGARRALDAFERRNQNKAKEYSMVVNADGDIIGEAGGRARSTALTQGQNIASEGNYHIHNHPIENIIYSDQDIVNYEKYGVRGGIVITRDGTEYQLINSNPVSRYNEIEELRRNLTYGDMTEEEYSRRYRELMPFSSSVTGAFNTIETEWREERRATLDRIYAELPLPSDRDGQIAVRAERNSRYDAWVESVGNDNDRKIRWLEENASLYGFTFIRRRIR